MSSHLRADDVNIEKTNNIVTSAGAIDKEESSASDHSFGKPPWWAYIWDWEPGRTPEERRFVQKLDIHLVTILSLGFFMKYLDTINIGNAYVSGMREDLGMLAKQLNVIDAAWTSGYVVGQIPSQILLTKVRASWWIPFCQLVWTTLTFCMAAVKTSDQVVALRFFIGLFESTFYPAAMMILGSWYLPSELGKRSCIFVSDVATHAETRITLILSSLQQVLLEACSAVICKLRYTKGLKALTGFVAGNGCSL
jgi:sugar phosphate permease